jgi:hypothetical protein
MIALPTLFHSIQVLLSYETSAEKIVLAAHTLSTSFIQHFKQIISNPKSHYHFLPDPTHAIQSIFALLAIQYIAPKIQSQRSVIGQIIMDLTTNTLAIINESCLLAINAAIYNDPFPKDYRDALSQGILTICSIIKVDSSLRQALLLGLIVEFRRVRRESREGRLAVLARDDMLWYLYTLIEEVVNVTGIVGDIIGVQATGLVWEIISTGIRENEGMTKGNWLAWNVCGLLCGVGAIKLDF